MARKSGSRPRSDDELVREFLEKYDGRSGPWIERNVPAVTQSDVSRWRNGQWTRLSGPKRAALEMALTMDVGLPDTHVRKLQAVLVRARHLVEELESLVDGEDSAGTSSTGDPNDPDPSGEGWAMHLAEVADLDRLAKRTEAHYWARVAKSLYRELLQEGRLRTADQQQWEAFTRGRDSVPWKKLKPMKRADLPIEPDLLFAMAPGEVIGSLKGRPGG